MPTFFILISLSSLLLIPSEIHEKASGMVLVPGGTFQMGKPSENGANYSPRHTVTVDSFMMDKHPVTNEKYMLFCTKAGHRLPEFWNVDLFRSGEEYLNYPVIGVSWADAMKYAQWAGKRLPTEAEWEYAARGGLAEHEFPDGNEWKYPRLKNDPGQWTNQIMEVGLREANGFGLFDMADNVWELVADRYADDYYDYSPVENPTGPAKGSNVVIRGGSWHSGAMCKKVYYRKGIPNSWIDFGVGFRCAKDL